MTQTNPEQWAVELWRDAQLASFNVLYGAVNKTKDRADRAAALAIQAAFAEREARLVGALEWYGDTFCELGSSHECCGRLSSDECSGCQARATLAALKDRTHG